jgi:predicted MFS family arabinose efflux permease
MPNQKALMAVLTFLCLSESHAPTIKRQKGKTQEDSNENRRLLSTKKIISRSILRPLRMLVLSPIISGLSLYLALIYGYLYLLFTTFSTVFPEQYGFRVDSLGLAFLGLGIGCMIALVLLSWLSDWLHEKMTKKHDKARPEYALFLLSKKDKSLREE